MKFNPRVLSVMLLAGALAIGFQPFAQADFVAPNSWNRGDSDTTYQHWSFFFTATDAVPNSDDNPNGTSTLSETSGLGGALGSGNLYSANPAVPAVLAFEVTIPVADVPSHDLTAIVQLQTGGTELDINSPRLNGIEADGYFELANAPSGGFGGAVVDHWFLFKVPYADYGSGNPGTAELTLTFDPLGTHMSLNQALIDTATSPNGFFPEALPVPEPTSALLLSLAVGSLLSLRRFSR